MRKDIFTLLKLNHLGDVGDARVVEELMSLKDLNIRCELPEEEGIPLISYIIQYGNRNYLTLLLEKFPQAINEKTFEGDLPLEIAIQEHKSLLLPLLIPEEFALNERLIKIIALSNALGAFLYFLFGRKEALTIDLIPARLLCVVAEYDRKDWIHIFHYFIRRGTNYRTKDWKGWFEAFLTDGVDDRTFLDILCRHTHDLSTLKLPMIKDIFND